MEKMWGDEVLRKRKEKEMTVQCFVSQGGSMKDVR